MKMCNRYSVGYSLENLQLFPSLQEVFCFFTISRNKLCFLLLMFDVMIPNDVSEDAILFHFIKIKLNILYIILI